MLLLPVSVAVSSWHSFLWQAPPSSSCFLP
ncbi:hypothetical protein E2C01_095820 [Portunus trituberculatus]|uniref:Uncharacterized protein n=1 Tax=Portunus trituberculatus TaxID=210409 RepID=A0A5B7K157_PORTR|nr:hypothetical protein [Portunus trituberculatus]